MGATVATGLLMLWRSSLLMLWRLHRDRAREPRPRGPHLGHALCCNEGRDGGRWGGAVHPFLQLQFGMRKAPNSWRRHHRCWALSLTLRHWRGGATARCGIGVWLWSPREMDATWSGDNVVHTASTETMPAHGGEEVKTQDGSRRGHLVLTTWRLKIGRDMREAFGGEGFFPRLGCRLAL
jgi:hypothetical protein